MLFMIFIYYYDFAVAALMIRSDTWVSYANPLFRPHLLLRHHSNHLQELISCALSFILLASLPCFLFLPSLSTLLSALSFLHSIINGPIILPRSWHGRQNAARDRIEIRWHASGWRSIRTRSVLLSTQLINLLFGPRYCAVDYNFDALNNF